MGTEQGSQAPDSRCDAPVFEPNVLHEEGLSEALGPKGLPLPRQAGHWPQAGHLLSGSPGEHGHVSEAGYPA